MADDCPTYEFTQTLFLGCSVQRFAANLGFNEQPTTVNITLVRDVCPGPKIYYDPEPVAYTAADPGFRIYGESGTEPPEIGAPVFFKFGTFEFCGLIQTWQQVEPASDTEIYEVTLASPVELLQGTNLILSEYAGAVKGFNIFNIYGFLEWAYGNPGTTFSQSVTDGVMFGSVAEGFGGADLTEAGIPWSKARQAISILTSALPMVNFGAVEAFSQYGRVCFVGAARGGYGLIPYDSINVAAGGVFTYAKHISEYYLDLSDLPFSTTDIRIPGNTSDILSIIGQVAQELAHDYYVELKLLRINGNLSKVIKIRPISRQNQPTLGVVEDFIEAINEGGVIASSFGRELRNESTTNFIVGGKKRSMYQVTNGIPIDIDPDAVWLEANYPGNTYVKDTIVPYFGTDAAGNVLVVQKDEDEKEFISMSSDGLKQSLVAIGSAMGSTIKIYLEEIKQAGAGYAAYTSYLSTGQNYSLPEFDNRLGKVIATFNPFFRGKYSRAGNLPGSIEGKTSVRDFVDTINVSYSDEISEDVNRIFQFVYKLYETSQSQVMVRIPYVNAKRILTTEGTSSEILGGRLVTSDSPVEGGWTEVPNVIGLANPGSIIDYFKNEDGTIHSFGMFLFQNGLDVSAIPEGLKYFFQEVDPEEAPGDYVMFAEVQTLEELVFLDSQNAISPRAIVQIPQLTEAAGYNKDNQFNAHAITANLSVLNGNINQSVEKELWKMAIRPQILEPYKLALAFASNENTYGPWKPDNVIEAGPPGRTNIQKDETLVPWTYGSYANMSLVAQAKADESVGGMQAGENGSITLDGIPTVLLGSELAYSSVGEWFENLSNSTETISVTTDYNSLSYNVPYVPMAVWTGSNGPNVNSVNCQISKQGITTTYEFRTFSPKFGTLSKYNANQLSQRLLKENRLLGRQRFLAAVNNVQTANAKRLAPITISIGGGSGKKEENSSADDSVVANPPPAVLCADFSPFRRDDDLTEETTEQTTARNKIGRKRTIVAAKPISSLGEEVSNSGYDTKAFLSWDGFFRPVSLSGSGGLPRMIKAINEDVYDTGSDTNTITNKYLNFLANPSGYDFSELDLLHTGNDGGHDVEVVGRSTYAQYTGAMSGSGNSPSLVTPTNVISGQVVDGYADDYRFLALRGPLWMQSWGFDTDGKPVPNEADNMQSMLSGEFTSTGLTNKFYPDWLKKPQTWPVAPLDIRLNRERGVWEAGAGGGGTTSEMVMVLDDIPGYVIENMNGTPPAVRAISRVWSDATLGVDGTTAIFDVYAVEPNQITLDASPCCSDDDADGGTDVDGLIFSTPFSSNNSIDESDISAVTIVGEGVANTSIVHLTISEVGTFESPTDFTVSDNQFSITANLSGVTLASHTSPGSNVVNNGVCKISAYEETVGAINLEERHIAINIRLDYDSESLYWVSGSTHAIKPRLSTGQDTGRSATDNWTSVTSPVVEFECSSTLAGAGDHWIAIYVDGELSEILSQVDNEGVSTPGSGYTYLRTLQDTLTAGTHSIQFFEIHGNNTSTEAMWGPMSNPLWLIIDPAETGVPPEETFEFSDIRYGRHGYVDTFDGKKTLTKIEPCPIKLTTLLSDRLNGYIVGTGIASADFDIDDTSIAIDSGSWVIINDTEDADPTAPTTLDLTSVNLAGSDGDVLNARWEGGQWRIRGVS